MEIYQLIKDLKKSNLVAECPHGEGEFRLSEAILFDGTQEFPEEALETQEKLLKALEKRTSDLEKKIKRATKTNIITTRATNIGNFLEMAIPTARDFKWIVPDSKYLGKPIDLLVFNGLSNGKVKSLSFVEVKTGDADLTDNEESIRDAIDDRRVSYKVFV